MTKYDWLLLVHIAGAFLLVSGSVVAGLLQLAAVRRERPSEVALLLRLTRPAVLAVAIGSLVTLGLGIWLAEYVGYGLGAGWVSTSIVLWVVAMALGGAGGLPMRHARELAQRLAEDGDRPSPELRRAVADPRAAVLSYLGLAALVAILMLMVWKPG